MYDRFPRLIALSFLFAAQFSRLAAQDASAPLTLSNGQGAVITLTADDTGAWAWTRLATPATPDGSAIVDRPVEVTVNNVTESLVGGWTLANADVSQIVLEHDAPASGLQLRRVVSFGPADNVLRIETWARATSTDRELQRITLLSAQVGGEGFYQTGTAPASYPVFGNALFFGVEHVTADCSSDQDTVRLAQSPHLAISSDWKLVAAIVVGWPVPTDDSVLNANRMREAFLRYLDTVRLKPERIELHTNTWWTLPLPFSEADVLKDITALRTGFYDRTGMFFDSYALDLGWSNPQSVWRVDAARFPNALRTIKAKLDETGTKLGLWISPGSAYKEGLDNNWLAQQGYEVEPFGDINVACFALGNRYQQATKESIVGYAQEYSLGHVKLDFMAHICDVATHGHPTGADSYFATDAGLADVLDSLRAVNPKIVLEPLCAGYPPSPWWTMHTPYVLGPDGDDVPYGRVPCPEWIESLVTARDIAYRSAQENWMMPTQSLETFDIVVQTAGDFENMAAMAIGRGRWFISTYLKPELMKPTDWDFLAAMVRWERENKGSLVNARQFGGRPENRDAYGYFFHNPDRDLYCIRNPWIEERSIVLPVSSNLSEARDVRMIYPRRALVARLQPGADAPRISIAPYETALFETVPATDTPVPDLVLPQVGMAGTTLRVDGTTGTKPTVHYTWDASLDVPAGNGAELYVLVEATPDVKSATCNLTLAGRAVKPQTITSEGQWAAAGAPSPDHWMWFTTPLRDGQQSVHVDVNVPVSPAAISVFVRGKMPALSDPAPDGVNTFPVFHPDQRAWSQTLQPAASYSGDTVVVSSAPAPANDPTTDSGIPTDGTTPPPPPGGPIPVWSAWLRAMMKP
jgi:hypothetical protein